jgi:formyltetrahydrofolate deformylase
MSNADPSPHFVLTLSGPDRIGIVAAVSSFLLAHRCNILDSAQFGDSGTNRFFMRVDFAPETPLALADLQRDFAPVAEPFGLQWSFHDGAEKTRTLIMVSRFGHCLNDLLYRYRIGALPIVIPAVVSNHADFRTLVEANGIPFHHLPVTSATKAAQERQLLDLIAAERCELVVLARYMQVLSQDLCRELAGKAINIHHSFLPSFKGARPYHQAHERGVKLIGATAHYVTDQLDEGPIIEQDVARVDHAMTPDEMVAIGRDVEAVVLARAVRWHSEHRVLLNGTRTVVFR